MWFGPIAAFTSGGWQPQSDVARPMPLKFPSVRKGSTFFGAAPPFVPEVLIDGSWEPVGRPSRSRAGCVGALGVKPVGRFDALMCCAVAAVRLPTVAPCGAVARVATAWLA